MSRRHILLPDSLASLFTRLEELVLANSGADEFEEIFKLLVAKLWSERTCPARFRVYDSARETFEALHELFAEACRAWSGLFEAGEAFRLAPEQLSLCAQALAEHDLLAAGGEALDATFEFLISGAAKGKKGQYFTPRQVVDLCVRMMRPRRSETIVDPACGSGAFLLHSLSYLRESGELASDEAVAPYCSERLWGFDFDARAIRVARALLLVAGAETANLVCINSLTRVNSTLPRIEDVLRRRHGPSRGFDLVLTNPPFAGDIREPELLESYTLSAGRPRVERDVLFLERCIELLRPGGRLCIVLPHNKFAAESFASLREWLIEKVQVVAVIGLGRNTFMPHTSQKASVLFGTRRSDGKRASADEPVFFGVSEREGKDARGEPKFLPPSEAQRALSWRDLDHDLGELLRGFEAHVSERSVPWIGQPEG